MRNLVRNTSLVFAAGCLGGLFNSLAVWIFGELGITAALGVKIAPQLSPAFLYPRLVWGGIWGLLFLLPLMKTRIFSKFFRVFLHFAPDFLQIFAKIRIFSHFFALFILPILPKPYKPTQNSRITSHELRT